MSEQRRPKTLLKRLKARVGDEIEIDYHMFRGIENKDTKCYVNSIIQLFFHSNAFLSYLDGLKIDTDNETEKLLKQIYNDFKTGDKKSININNFYSNWKGWGKDDQGHLQRLPHGFQDAFEFFMNFTDTISDDLLSLYCFRATQALNNQQLEFFYLNVTITSSNLRECVKNAESEYNTILDSPHLLFVQLDRAIEPQKIRKDFVSVNKTIIFNSQFYNIIGIVVFEDDQLHYHSIINICDEFFDFDDSNVSPLFLDDSSVYPSSYKRCLINENLIQRNSVLFLYEISSQDDLTIVHFSPSIQRMMTQENNNEQILQIHEGDDPDDKYLEVPNKDLLRVDINVSDMESNDLHGIVKISSSGVPPKVIEPIKDNRFMKNRKLFKLIANVMREMKEIDQGKLNSDLVLDKFDFESDEKEFIQVQGCILYDIITNVLLEKEKLTIDEVKHELQPIFDSYEAKYKAYLEDELTNPKLFTEKDDCFDDDSSNDCINNNNNDDNDDDNDDPKEIPPLTFFQDNVLSNDVEDKGNSDSDDSLGIIHLEHGEGEILSDENGVRIWKTTTNSFEDLTLNYTNEKINSDDDECPNDYGDDDNQFSLKDYDWKERAEILNAFVILQEIRTKMKEKYNKRKKPNLGNKSSIKKALTIECLREWKKTTYKTVNYFAKQWIANNVTCVPRNALVQAYNDIIKEENKAKEEKSKKLLEELKKQDEEYFASIDVEDNDEETKDFIKNVRLIHELQIKEQVKYEKSKDYEVSIVTIKHWIQKYKSDEKLREKVNNETLLSEGSLWGGPHNLKLTDEALTCLICLALDFPNLPAKQFATYLNSKYGPCGELQKHVTSETVSRALKSLNFSVKRAAFCPPARNSIGLRIYRVAWSLLMQEISNQNDVLLGFIDEAAISIGDGKKYGRSFVGITPLINSPLSSCKVAVLACVLPGYGVLYKFFDTSVHGIDYCQFLEDITNFIRIHICSSKAQIVFIEDNCRIHCTEDVENKIEKLKIAVIPTVPYSPALNEVVEGYFGYIKLAHLEYYSDDWDQQEPSCDEKIIRETWEKISTQKFDDSISNSLYAEWKARMAKCVEGVPLVSGHIDTEEYKKDAHRLLNVKVFRHYKEVKYI